MIYAYIKRFFLVSLLLISSVVFVFAEGAPEEQPEVAESAAYPMTVTDDEGKEVTIDRIPQRIVSLTVFTDDVLMEIVEPGRIAALTTFADDPAISNIADKADAVENKITLNVEVVLSLDPDLVFVANWSDANKIKQLRDARVPVFLLETPLTIDEVADKIRTIGAVVAEDERAQAVIREMRSKIAEVEEAVADIPESERKTVVDYAVWGTAQGGNSSWQELVDRAGLVNAAEGLPVNDYGQIPLSKEKLVELDPDILVLPGWVYGNPDGADEFYNQITNDPALRTMQAIKNDMAIQMPENLKSTTSHYMAEAIVFLAKEAYPDRF